jgi:hypothetical protein
MSRNSLTRVQKDLVGVGPSDDETEKILDLGRDLRTTLPHLSLKPVDLNANDFAETEPPRQAQTDVLLLENLFGSVSVAHRLKEDERKHRRNRRGLRALPARTRTALWQRSAQSQLDWWGG